ncbi:MAG: 16S rRNA (guanine(966)-N(2))-methyltransferase RsmD [Atopobiaceae bacterium]
MRIVGGTWRGRPLEAPDGRGTTRPTTDRVRESMASMILSAAGLDLGGMSALDAFAGSGALGIELLSRGAAHVTFCDRDRGAAARVRRNLSSVGAPASCYAILQGDAERLAARASLPGAPFDVVVLDPPSAMGADAVASIVRGLASGGLLAPQALVAYERSADAPALSSEGFAAIRQKRYGSTSVDLLRRDV